MTSWTFTECRKGAHEACPGVRGKGSKCSCSCGHVAPGNEAAQEKAACVALTPAQFIKWMADRDMSSADLQRALGVSRNTVRNWRTGTHPVDKLIAMALRGLDAERGDEQRDA